MKAKLFGASLAFWCAFVLFGLKPGHLAMAGSRSDAPAHIDSTILFLSRGFGVYRVPLDRLGARSRTEAAHAITAAYGWPADGVTDLLDVPERVGKPPLLVNWSYIPRPYPPGVFLYFLPEALLKEAFSLSPKTAARLALLKMIVAAHAFLWLFWSALFPPKEGDAASNELAAWIVFPLVYAETILWTLHGFYDAAAMLPLLLSVDALRKKKGLRCVSWCSLSLFLHFRSLWYLPLLAAGAWTAWKNGELKRFRAEAAVSAVMLALSAYAFVLVYPWLMTLRPTNFFLTSADAASLARLAYLLAPMGLIGAALAVNRAWLPLACLGWTLVMVARSPFLQMWHSLYLTPLFAFTRLGERSAGRSRIFLLVAYLVMASIAFTYFSFNGILIQEVISELRP